MPHTSEVAFNSHFGEILRQKHPLWRSHISVEQTGVFATAPRLQPDVLIQAPNAQPVVLETEYLPGATVEDDAKARLGLVPLDAADPIEQAIAVRIPSSLARDQDRLTERIAAARFDYCVLSGDPTAPARWPVSGWLTGRIDDIVRCIEHAMVSQRLVDDGMSVLEQGVRVATRAIQDATTSGYTDIERHIGSVLNQREGEQTTRMAMTIIANALTFHATIAGAHDIPSVAQIKNNTGPSLQTPILETWKRILVDINYWPIFKVASDLLAPIRSETADRILDVLTMSAGHLAAIGIATRHDLSGRMFQNLITDRKFLATFYTMPTSAALLAEVAIARLARNRELPDITIADLSCGTGTLLTAAYQAMLARYRHAGGDDRQIHRRMIERNIIAADIMPAAAHLCASQLSSVHPTVIFDNTRVYTLPYGVGTGRQQYRGVAIGSLELTALNQTQSLFTTGQRQATGVQGDIDVKDIELPPESVDLVIMNPPFTRPTNHESTDVPVPSFAGFRTSEAEQRSMSNRLKEIRAAIDNPVGHGNAGLASNFVDLAHGKLKERGTLALVLPIAAIQGTSWSAVRQLFERNYSDVVVFSIATSGTHDRAFSADTGMAELMIVGTKGRDSNRDVLFVNLHRRPGSILEAVEAAKLVSELSECSRSGQLSAGDQVMGSYVRASLKEGGCAALRESHLAGVMFALQRGQISLPRCREDYRVPVTRLGQVGRRGLLHRDIGDKNDGTPPFRGPFEIVTSVGVPSYPVLWRHEANRERRLLVHPDSEGAVRSGCADRAIEAWQTSTRLHFSLDFQLNSQSLAACLTPEASLGGRAWPNLIVNDSRWEEVICLWANCTLGLMAFWWAGSRQQEGRAVMTISSIPNLTVLDPRRLSTAQISRAADIFGDFQDRTFLPANEAYQDATRRDLDRAVLIDLLELPEGVIEPLENVCRQWCNEPTVHGGKSTSPGSHRWDRSADSSPGQSE